MSACAQVNQIYRPWVCNRQKRAAAQGGGFSGVRNGRHYSAPPEPPLPFLSPESARYTLPKPPIPIPTPEVPKVTPIELFTARAALGSAIGMTMQEWRELCDDIAALPIDTQYLWDEVLFAMTYNGKQILIAAD